MQGINDLVTPFLAVFLSEHFSGSIDGWDLSTVPPERMLEVRRRLDRRAFAPPGQGRSLPGAASIQRAVRLPHLSGRTAVCGAAAGFYSCFDSTLVKPNVSAKGICLPFRGPCRRLRMRLISSNAWPVEFSVHIRPFSCQGQIP